MKKKLTILDDYASQGDAMLLSVPREIERDGAPQRTPEQEEIGGVDLGMFRDGSERRSRVQLQSSFARLDGVAVPVPSIFDHEDVRVQVLHHVRCIRKAKTDIASISVKEYQRGEIIFSLGSQEQPSMNRNTILAFNVHIFVRNLVFFW